LILLILLILIGFSIILAVVWAWFFKNERAFCEKLYSAGVKAFEELKFQKAKTFFSKINSINPSYKDVTYKLGLTCFELLEYDKATTYFESVIKITPKNFDALFHLALSFQLQELYDKAEEAYKKALKENEKSGDCLFGLGFICYKQTKYKEAIEFFENAKETFADKVKLDFYINKCHDELTTYDEDSQSAKIIEEYLKIANEPKLPKEFNISLAFAYAKTGQIPQALEYCKKSLLENPEDIESYKLLGLIQLVQQDYVATKSTISTALHLQPNNKELHNILSYVLCQQIDNCELQDCRNKYHELIKNFLI